MRFYLLLIAISLAHTTFGQSFENFKFLNESKLPQTIRPNVEYQTEAASTYNLVGKTSNSIIVQETLLIKGNNQYDSKFKSEVLFHFYSLDGKKLKFSKTVWLQPMPYEKNLYSDNMVEPPEFFILKDAIYSYNKNWSPEVPEDKKDKKLKVVHLQKMVETVDNLDITTKTLHNWMYFYKPFKLEIASDSSCLFALDAKQNTQKGKKHGILIFDTNLEETDFLQMSSRVQDCFVFKDKVLYKFGSTKKEKSMLNLYWMRSKRTDAIQLIDENEKKSHSQHFFLSKLSENELVLLRSNNRETGRDKWTFWLDMIKVKLGEDTIITSKITKLNRVILTEIDNGDQRDFQTTYFKSLPDETSFVNKYGHVVISQSIGSKFIGIAAPNTGYPVFVGINHAAPCLMVDIDDEKYTMFKRVYLNDGANVNPFQHVPLFLPGDEHQFTFLYNYISVTDINDEKHENVLLQLIKVDLEDSSLTRFNLTDFTEDPTALEKYHIEAIYNPIMSKKHIICISENSEGLFLCEITW